MEVGCYLDKLNHPYAHEGTLNLLRALAERGHRVVVTTPQTGWGEFQRDHPAMQHGHRGLIDPREAYPETTVDRLEAILLRHDPPVDWEGAQALLARHPEAIAINNPQQLIGFSKKYMQKEAFARFTPQTHYLSDPAAIVEVVEALKDAILKPLDGYGGHGITKVHRRDDVYDIAQHLTRDGLDEIVVQEFLPRVTEGDKRVIMTADGQALGALLRVPQEGTYLANITQGGAEYQCAPDERDREIARAIAPQLAADGLHIVGADLIDGKLTEINARSFYLNPEMAATAAAWLESYVAQTKAAQRPYAA